MIIAPLTSDIEAVEHIATHEEVFYQSAEFWVGAAFILVVAGLFVPVSNILKKLILARIDRIKSELHEAETLKLDAQKLYAEYERKFANTDKEVDEIIIRQKNIIEETKEKKLQELNQLLKNKKEDAEAKMEQALKVAKEEINREISARSITILTEALSSKLTKADYNNLINKSITNIKNMQIGENNG